MRRNPDSWEPPRPGQGTCFHAAIDRWALLDHAHGGTGWQIAIGIVGKNPYCLERHLHAWIEAGDATISAVTGTIEDRPGFYRRVGIEPHTVRLIPNSVPRRILRRGELDREAIVQLLNAWGKDWAVRNGGIVPADNAHAPTP